MGWRYQPHAQPPTRRTRVSVFVWVITFDLSGMGGPTGSYATANIVLRIIWPRKSHHYVKTLMPSGGGGGDGCPSALLNVRNVSEATRTLSFFFYDSSKPLKCLPLIQYKRKFPYANRYWITVTWDVTPCSLVNTYWSFSRICRPYHQTKWVTSHKTRIFIVINVSSPETATVTMLKANRVFRVHAMKAYGRENV
jgi:hypothetical protein